MSNSYRDRTVDAIRQSRRGRGAGRTMEIRGPVIRGDDGKLRQEVRVLGAEPEEENDGSNDEDQPEH